MSKKESKLKKNSALGYMILAITILSTGCTEANRSADGSVIISGTLSEGQGQQKASLGSFDAALSDYEVYCVTFSQPAVAGAGAINSDGYFVLTMPANVNFGCFVNNSLTKEPVATFSVAGSGDNFGGGSSSTLALSGSVDLGNLHLDLEKGEVEIPADVIAPVASPIAESDLNIEDLHDSTYMLTCIKTGNPKIDARCVSELQHDIKDEAVFFRIMKATRNGQPVYGLGIWESQQRFLDCGAMDLTDSTVAKILAEDAIEFLPGGVASAPAFTIDPVLCPLRDPSGDNVNENIQKYYTAGELVKTANGYALDDKHMAYPNSGCVEYNETHVVFTGDNAEKLVGKIHSVQKFTDLNNDGSCDHLRDLESDDFFMIQLEKAQ